MALATPTLAAIARVNDGSLSRRLKSAAAENALPCARSSLDHGFYPTDVSLKHNSYLAHSSDEIDPTIPYSDLSL